MSPNNWLSFLNLDFEAQSAAIAGGQRTFSPQQQQQQQQLEAGGRNQIGNNSNSYINSQQQQPTPFNDTMLSGGFDFSSSGVGGGINNSPLSDDLKAQLEAWTNVSFGGDDLAQNGNNNNNVNNNNGNADSTFYNMLSGTGDDMGLSSKKDPSPYAKRPFGNFTSNYQILERGFNAFHKDGIVAPTNTAANSSETNTPVSQPPSSAPTPVAAPPSTAGNNGNDTYNGFNSNGSNSGPATWPAGLPVFDFTKTYSLDATTFQFTADQSNSNGHNNGNGANRSTTFTSQQLPVVQQTLTDVVSTQVHNQNSENANTQAQQTSSAQPPAKRQKHSASVSSSSSASPASKQQQAQEQRTDSESNTSASTSDTYINADGVLVKRQPLLTKAEILAKQLDELKTRQGRTPEEEALRQAELNRIAAEDDKRRRNTAASARFRVKKKQREAALEDTINELKGKMATLEQELGKTKNENAFLRDLVIRKIGLADLGSSSTGPSFPVQPPVQHEVTGVGTQHN